MSLDATPANHAQDRPFPPTPAPIHVPDEVLADLRRRLELTRWPEDAGNQDRYFGVNRDWLQELVDHWRSAYDWRRGEAAINVYEHYRSRSRACRCTSCAGPESARTRPR